MSIPDDSIVRECGGFTMPEGPLWCRDLPFVTETWEFTLDGRVEKWRRTQVGWQRVPLDPKAVR